MTTAIRGLKNDTRQEVSFQNLSHSGDDRDHIKPGELADVYAWIPDNEEKGLYVYDSEHQTHWRIWDVYSRINARSSRIRHVIILRDGVKDKQDYELTVTSDGDLSVNLHR